jgi:hypothetical protein
MVYRPPHPSLLEKLRLRMASVGKIGPINSTLSEREAFRSIHIHLPDL